MEKQSAPQRPVYRELDYRWHPIKPERRGKYQLEVYHNREWLPVSIYARHIRNLYVMERTWVIGILEGMRGVEYTKPILTHVAYSIARGEVTL